MDTLDTRLFQTLCLLGGPTAGNANLLGTAVFNRLQWLESQMRRDLSEEAAEIRRENTHDTVYPVPADHLPAPGPVAFPPPPPGLFCLPYITLFSAVDRHLVSEFARFHSARSFAVVESQTLRVLRTFREQFNTALAARLPAPQIIPNPPASMAVDTYPLDTSTPTEVWTLYERDRNVEVLELFAPLLNSYTARLPAFILRHLIFHMEHPEMWTVRLTRATLHMLASSLIAALTFHHPTLFIINTFSAQDGGLAVLRYVFDGSSAAARLDLHDGRCVTLTNVGPEAELALLSQLLSQTRVLVLSNLQRAHAAAAIWRAAPRALARLTIEVDRRAVGWPHAALLAYRGAAWAERPHLTALSIAAAPECEGTVDVRRADLQGFMAAAFPDVSDVELERISILP